MIKNRGSGCTVAQPSTAIRPVRGIWPAFFPGHPNDVPAMLPASRRPGTPNQRSTCRHRPQLATTCPCPPGNTDRVSPGKAPVLTLLSDRMSRSLRGFPIETGICSVVLPRRQQRLNPAAACRQSISPRGPLAHPTRPAYPAVFAVSTYRPRRSPTKRPTTSHASLPHMRTRRSDSPGKADEDAVAAPRDPL